MISVCLAAFNGERHIAEQLRSILAAPQVGEVIVSDDGSTDRTAAIVAALDDPRLRLVRGPGRGLIANFESLLRQARGELVFLSDQDDVWLPGRVEAMAAALQKADLVVCDCRVVDEALHELQPSFFRARGSGPGFWRNLLRNSYLGCCMAFRRSLLERVLPFPPAIPMHDWWIGLVAERSGRVCFLDLPLTLYRRHGGNASTTAGRSTAPLRRQLGWRVTLLKALVRRLRPPQSGGPRAR